VLLRQYSVRKNERTKAFRTGGGPSNERSRTTQSHVHRPPKNPEAGFETVSAWFMGTPLNGKDRWREDRELIRLGGAVRLALLQTTAASRVQAR